ncbi:MAG: redoxin domain-containing protein [Planctomycetaceae bacterium]
MEPELPLVGPAYEVAWQYIMNVPHHLPSNAFEPVTISQIESAGNTGTSTPSSPRHLSRFGPWLLPLAAIVIAGLCAYRVTRPPKPVVYVEPTVRTLAPTSWELPDHRKQLVKFDRYLGRHAVVLWFTGGAVPLEQDAVLRTLQERATELEDAGHIVLAVTPEPPSRTRLVGEQWEGGWKFPVLSDIRERDPSPVPVHQRWGRVDRTTGTPQPGLFLIDRLGQMEYIEGVPKPATDALAAIKELSGD